MRIAQIAPLAESCPPRLYGGTERVVSNLTEALVDLGHDVTLFASGDTVTRARLVPCTQTGLRFAKGSSDALPYNVVMLDRVAASAREFDILHFHIDYLQFALPRFIETPMVTTLHGRLDLPDVRPFYEAFPDEPLVSISQSQRLPMPPVNWAGTVYHGLAPDLLPFNPDPRGGYLAFLGRISPEKGPDQAIEIAARSGYPLKIAAKIDKVDMEYWQEVIAPRVAADPDVEFVGEIGEAEKAAFLGNAAAFLFPIDWPEPFGLVMIEAMSTGTPVISYAKGSVPEVITPGVSGWIVNGIEEAVSATRRIGMLDRARVRAAFEDRFTVDRMARDYLGIYRRLIDHPHSAFPLKDMAQGANVDA